MMQEGDWLVKLDLKDTYLTVPIHSSHQRFQWQSQTWELKVLPFGLSCAPYTFSKLMKPVVSTLRKLGIRSILYLDDMLIMARSKEEARKYLATAIELLVALGFIVNLKKSTLTPTQELEFLGFLLNSHNMTIGLPAHKLHTLKKMARGMADQKRTTLRKLAFPFRDDGSSSSSNPTSSSPLQTSRECQIKGTSEWPYIRGRFGYRSQHRVRSGMVAKQLKPAQWETLADRAVGSDNRIRCVRKGLGSQLPRSKHWRPLVRSLSTV